MTAKLQTTTGLVAAVAVLGCVATVLIVRFPFGASGKAPPIPATPAADVAAVEKLVPLSISEEIIRTSGYQTIRVETTNRAAGYATSTHFTRTGPGQSWARQKFEVTTNLQSDVITVVGSIRAGEVLSLAAALDIPRFGQIQSIVMKSADSAEVKTGHPRPLAGRYFTVRLVRTEGAWRVSDVLMEGVS